VSELPPKRPMPITAVLLDALMPTPQFWQEPPEKPAVALDPLVIVVSEDPLMMSTLVLFSVHTTSPVVEFEAQELTPVDVAKCCAELVPSSGPPQCRWWRVVPVGERNVRIHVGANGDGQRTGGHAGCQGCGGDGDVDLGAVTAGDGAGQPNEVVSGGQRAGTENPTWSVVPTYLAM